MSLNSETDDLPLPLPPNPPYRSRNTSGANSPLREQANFDFSSPTRPALGRAATNDGFGRAPPPQRPTYADQQQSNRQVPPPRPTRAFRSASTADNVFGDPTAADDFSSSPEKPWDTSFDRSSSPTTSTSNTSMSRTGSWSALSTLDSASSGTTGGRFGAQNGVGLPGMTGGFDGAIGGGIGAKKAPPPPPPPSRASKPKTGPPPPPPLKRSALSTTSVPYAA